MKKMMIVMSCLFFTTSCVFSSEGLRKRDVGPGSQKACSLDKNMDEEQEKQDPGCTYALSVALKGFLRSLQESKALDEIDSLLPNY